MTLPSPWFVDRLSATSNNLTLFYHLDQKKCIVMTFSPNLPTFVHINEKNSDTFEISTDALITNFKQLDDVHEQINTENIINIPVGKRFGTFTVLPGNTLMYVHEFWKVPSIFDDASKSPEMVLVRPREPMTFLLNSSMICAQ